MNLIFLWSEAYMIWFDWICVQLHFMILFYFNKLQYFVRFEWKHEIRIYEIEFNKLHEIT